MIHAQAPTRLVAPSEPMVSLDSAKQHLRVDHEEDDTLITSLIDAATDHLDGWSGILGRCLVSQTWRQSFACRPAGRVLRLPFGAVSEAEIIYYDPDDAPQTFAADGWELVEDARSSMIRLRDGASWPSLAKRSDAMSVDMVTGYGTAEQVPHALRTAALLLVAHWYRNREAVNVGNITSALPLSVASLIAPYRRVGV